MGRAVVVLAHETGHRSASIRQLRWSDVDFTQQTIRWDPNSDKIGYGHTTPLTDTAIGLLAREQCAQGAIGDAWIFPARRGDRSKPMTGDAVFNLWARLAQAANLPRVLTCYIKGDEATQRDVLANRKPMRVVSRG